MEGMEVTRGVETLVNKLNVKVKVSGKSVEASERKGSDRGSVRDRGRQHQTVNSSSTIIPLWWADHTSGIRVSGLSGDGADKLARRASGFTLNIQENREQGQAGDTESIYLNKYNNKEKK